MLSLVSEQRNKSSALSKSIMSTNLQLSLASYLQVENPNGLQHITNNNI